MVEGRDVERGT
jgi:hypothetical protein